MAKDKEDWTDDHRRTDALVNSLVGYAYGGKADESFVSVVSGGLQVHRCGIGLPCAHEPPPGHDYPSR